MQLELDRYAQQAQHLWVGGFLHDEPFWMVIMVPDCFLRGIEWCRGRVCELSCRRATCISSEFSSPLPQRSRAKGKGVSHGNQMKPGCLWISLLLWKIDENRESLSGSLTGDRKAGTYSGTWGLTSNIHRAFIQILPRRTSLHWELCHMMSMIFSSPMQRYIRDDMVRQVLLQQAPYLHRKKKTDIFRRFRCWYPLVN